MSDRERPFLSRGPLPLNIAHRGGAEENPESTLLAFAHAVDQAAADILELDVWLTSDEAVVVYHDARIDRTTDGEGAIHEMTLAALQSLDAGHHFEHPERPGVYPHRGQGLEIPTLDQVLSRFPTTRINIDLKADDPALAENTLAIIAAHDAHPRACIGSFHDPVMRWVAEHAPDDVCLSASPEVVAEIVCAAKLGCLDAMDVRRWPYDVMQLPRAMYGLTLATPQLVERYHLAGWNLHVWTLNHPDEWRDMANMDADGIVTDRPSDLRRWLAAR